MAVTTWTEEDVERIIERWASDKLGRGEMIYDLPKWKDQARERIMRNERAWVGYIEGTIRLMDEHSETPPEQRRDDREDPAVALRRLYDAKIGHLTRHGVREPQRTELAVDYAVSEVYRCRILPMPPGGIGKLEDELCRSIGYDRATGLRFPPRAS